jgi:hypothetical protein
VCGDCIDIFAVDRDTTHGYAVRWFERSSFAPRGTGPVPLSTVDLGDLGVFGPQGKAICAACVLFGVRGTIGRKPGSRRKDFKSVSAPVVDRKDLEDVWPILLAEGKCFVDTDLSAFPTVVEALGTPARLEGFVTPRLVIDSGGAVGSGSSWGAAAASGAPPWPAASTAPSQTAAASGARAQRRSSWSPGPDRRVRPDGG